MIFNGTVHNILEIIIGESLSEPHASQSAMYNMILCIGMINLQYGQLYTSVGTGDTTIL